MKRKRVNTPIESSVERIVIWWGLEWCCVDVWCWCTLVRLELLDRQAHRGVYRSKLVRLEQQDLLELELLI